MFIQGKKHTTSQPKLAAYKFGYLLPVLGHADLLAGKKHQNILFEMRQLVDIDDENYDALYTSAIQNFVEFVQILPSQDNGALSGLLNEGLARALMGLKYFKAEQPLHEPIDPLMMYAVFSAALLCDISKVVINQHITLVDSDGDFFADWRPFEGTMNEFADFYKIYPIAPHFQRLETMIIPLLARQLMPKLGFIWISSDPQVFADWIEAISGTGGEGIRRLIDTLMLMKHEEILELLRQLHQVPVDMLENDATPDGDKFLDWLIKELKDDKLKTNSADASVHVTDTGIILEKKLFKQFADLYGLRSNTVFQQFGNLLGIAKKGGGDFAFDQFFSKYQIAKGAPSSNATFNSPFANKNTSIREGLLLADPGRVLMSAQVPAVSNMMSKLQSKQSAQSTRSLPLTQQQGMKVTLKAK